MKSEITTKAAMSHPDVVVAVEVLTAMQNRRAIEAVEKCRQIIYDACLPFGKPGECAWIAAKARIYHLLKELRGEQ